MTRLLVCSVSLLLASTRPTRSGRLSNRSHAQSDRAFLVDRYRNVQSLNGSSLTRLLAAYRMRSADDASGLASSLSAAGCSRFLSRSCMNSSYFAVPGLGGASAGMPPAHCGMAPLIPAASFSLMDPHPPRPHDASVTARATTRWRVPVDICLRSQPCLVSSRGRSRSLPRWIRRVHDVALPDCVSLTHQ